MKQDRYLIVFHSTNNLAELVEECIFQGVQLEEIARSRNCQISTLNDLPSLMVNALAVGEESMGLGHGTRTKDEWFQKTL